MVDCEACDDCPPSGRKRWCLIVAVLTFLIVVVVLAVKARPKTFKETFIARCEGFKGSIKYDCQEVWDTFEQAYVGRDQCDVPMENYDRLVALVPFQPSCNRMLFWSKLKKFVHDFNDKKKCFVLLGDTLLGSVIGDLTWCGKEGSSETFTTGCPEQNGCENSPVRSFWKRISAAFAESACGDVPAMLSGSIHAPFNSTTIFGSIEVPGLNPARVQNLTVVLVTKENSVANCTNASLKDLRKELNPGIAYKCKEVPESQIQECSSDPEKPCGACW